MLSYGIIKSFNLNTTDNKAFGKPAMSMPLCPDFNDAIATGNGFNGKNRIYRTYQGRNFHIRNIPL